MSTAIRLPDDLVEKAKKYASIHCRTVPKQIEYWAFLGRIADENPDLPLAFIKEVLMVLSDIKEGKTSTFEMLD